MLNPTQNISSWIDEENINDKEKQRREAIHVLLSAIASSEDLHSAMAMKGGVLLAIKYRSPRHTIDIDFSTKSKLPDINISALKEELDKCLADSSEKLPYGLACIVQSFKQNPKDPNATWPSFKIKIGYAYKHEPKKYRRLMNKNSSDIIKIDYSLNEVILDTELFELSDGQYIFIYSYTDLVSEKIRAVLQQEARKRVRCQDIYDLYYMLLTFGEPDDNIKNKILMALKEKSISRNLDINKTSMASPEIKKRSQERYKELEHDIYGELPPFEETYSSVQNFYESLPWKGNKFN